MHASSSTLTTVLRQAIVTSGLSFKRLEKETGVTRQSLMGFAKGQRTIYLDIADRLAAYFGLELKPKKKGM
jgi:plasmid maintenance system antidote protein VapI